MRDAQRWPTCKKKSNMQKKRDSFKMYTPFLVIGRQKMENGLILQQIIREKLDKKAF